MMKNIHMELRLLLEEVEKSYTAWCAFPNCRSLEEAYEEAQIQFVAGIRRYRTQLAAQIRYHGEQKRIPKQNLNIPNQ